MPNPKIESLKILPALQIPPSPNKFRFLKFMKFEKGKQSTNFHSVHGSHPNLLSLQQSSDKALFCDGLRQFRTRAIRLNDRKKVGGSFATLGSNTDAVATFASKRFTGYRVHRTSINIYCQSIRAFLFISFNKTLDWPEFHSTAF